jgi:Icc-related predicted phosphoesterase
MIVIALTDIHGDTRRLSGISNEIADADIVLLTGDITNFEGRDAAREVIETVGQWNRKILAIPGNCDFTEVGDYLSEEGLNLDRRSVIVDGIAFLGVGGSLPCPGKTPTEYSEADFGRFLEETDKSVDPDTPRILVVHQPPFDSIADRLPGGMHVGSRSVRSYIENRKPLICFTGHIHEGIGISEISGTKVANPGPAKSGGYTFARLEAGIEELEIRSEID